MNTFSNIPRQTANPSDAGEFGRFNYKFKKQTGGPGQYAHVIGRLEPCEESFIFENRVKGGDIPQHFIPACERGFREAMDKGLLAGYPVTGVKVILEGGSYHEVDSSDRAFQFAARQGFYQGFARANPIIIEPVMRVAVETPSQFFGSIQGDLVSRRGLLLDFETLGNNTAIRAEVPLGEMFRYSTSLHSLTSGQGRFSMEFACYRQVPALVQEQVIQKAAAKAWVK